MQRYACCHSPDKTLALCFGRCISVGQRYCGASQVLHPCPCHLGCIAGNSVPQHRRQADILRVYILLPWLHCTLRLPCPATGSAVWQEEQRVVLLFTLISPPRPRCSRSCMCPVPMQTGAPQCVQAYPSRLKTANLICSVAKLHSM